MRIFPILVLLYVPAAHALGPGSWTESQAKTICSLDLRRLYGDTLSVVNLMGKQPHENNTYLIGLTVQDNRGEYRKKQLAVGCIYLQDGSLVTVFFNSTIPGWEKPDAVERIPRQAIAPPSRPPSAGSQAKKSYSAAQLTVMVGRGDFPDQGPSRSTVNPMSFTNCLIAARLMIDGVHEGFPSSVIVDTSVMYSEKVWTKDAAVVVTCSLLDGNGIITVSPYQ